MTYTKEHPETIGVVSEGTLRPEDTVPAMHTLLGQLDPEAAVLIEIEWGDVLSDLEGNEFAIDVWAALDDAINAALPEGWYFGAHEGDGACLGVWRDQ